jgi:hypothetical protein
MDTIMGMGGPPYEFEYGLGEPPYEFEYGLGEPLMSLSMGGVDHL